MKKTFLITILLVFLFLNFISASSVGLVENSTWQNNLTGVRFSNTIFGDIDGDNNQDLIITGCLTDGQNDCENGAITKVYINNGTSLVESSTWQSNLTGIGWGSSSLLDIDNDGDLDLSLNGCTSSNSFGGNCDGILLAKIYINNGTSLTESQQWQQNLTPVFDSSMISGDIDNDGDVDIVINGKKPSTPFYITKVYINNGTSLVEDTVWQQNLIGVYEGQVVLGDLNEDNKLDLILSGDADFSDLTTKIYINNGTSFVENSTWQQDMTSLDKSSIIIGNIDQINGLDLLITGKTSSDLIFIYKNNLTTFLEDQNRDEGILAGIYRASLAFGDYDNDGDLDYLGFGNEHGNAKIYENNNSKFIQDTLAHANISDEIFKGSSAWNDIDNDGDLDLVITASDFVLGALIAKIYINNNTISNTQPNASTSGFSSTYSNNVLTLGWGNGSDIETPTFGLYYNLMVGNSTKNHTIVSGVYGGSSGGGGGSGGGANGYFGNMMQRKSITLNLQLESNKTYNWYVQTIDTGLAKSSWSAMQSFTTGNDTTKPSVTLEDPSPNASLHTTDPVFTFNATVTDANLTNVTLYADFNGTMIANETNSSGLNGTYTFTKNLTGNNDGQYSWYIYACDSDSNCQSSGTRSFYLDRGYPIVSLISPTGGSTSTSASVTFSYNVSDVDISSCSLIIDEGVDQTDSSITEDTTQTFTKTMSNGNYDWYVNCTDYVSYINNSATRSLTVSVSSGNGGTSSSGGGGGGTVTTSFWTSTEVVSDSDFEKGIVKELSKKQRVKVSVNNESHYIGIVDLTNTTATINISSDPIQVILGIGEDVKLDVLDDGFYDIYILLNSINESKANLTIQSINEKIPEGKGSVETSGNVTGDGTGEEEIDEKGKSRILFWGIVLGIIVIIILGLYFLKKYLWEKALKEGRKKWQK